MDIVKITLENPLTRPQTVPVTPSIIKPHPDNFFSGIRSDPYFFIENRYSSWLVLVPYCSKIQILNPQSSSAWRDAFLEKAEGTEVPMEAANLYILLTCHGGGTCLLNLFLSLTPPPTTFLFHFMLAKF